ncbi:MAG: Flp pilus assembly complex ATPase component TadA, partial [Magnetococcales bacterium]|nr:Flp pilus assembly complex ATPase component TadA [Magnetococcales bacterium]
VLSTLHTNDAVSTAIRLVDMGVESFAVASALRCILAQRLVRRVCKDCAHPYELEEHERVLLQGLLQTQDGHLPPLVKGQGCTQCNNSGYRGRIAIIEMLEVKGALVSALSRDDTAGFIEAAKKQKGYVPLHMAALNYAIKGVTTMEEVMRLTTEFSSEDDEDKDEKAEVATESA